MKKLSKIKIASIIATALVCGQMNQISVHATETPTFDTSGAQTAAEGFMTPLTTFCMWAIPVVTAVVLAISGIVWLTKDEDEKEQKPFVKTAKRIIIVAIILECIPTLLRIFGIS